MRVVVETVDIFHVIDSGTQGPPGTGGGAGIDDSAPSATHTYSSQKIEDLLQQPTGAAVECVSVWNGGDPQLVFTKNGDVVTNHAT